MYFGCELSESEDTENDIYLCPLSNVLSLELLQWLFQVIEFREMGAFEEMLPIYHYLVIIAVMLSLKVDRRIPPRGSPHRFRCKLGYIELFSFSSLSSLVVVVFGDLPMLL